MSSNGAFWPVGNIAMIHSLADDHKPTNDYKKLQPYQTALNDLFQTVIGLTPKILLAYLLLPFFTAPLESGAAATLDLSWATFDWVWPIAARDLIGSYAICFGWEWLLYSSPYASKMEKDGVRRSPVSALLRGIGAPYQCPLESVARYSATLRALTFAHSDDSSQWNEKYPSKAQIWHDQYHTFFCVLTATAVEALTLHLYATGTFANGSLPFFGAFAAYNVGWVACTTYWRLTHFWFTHRMMHPWKTTTIPDLGKILYKYVHSLHHKSYNPSTWAGLSMHPVEGAIYFTAAMIPAAFGAHPYTFILCKLCLAIDSWVAHDGFGPPSAGVYFHYLHHAHYDCNYGDTVVPLDWLFGSFIDAPPGSTKAAAAAAAAAATTVESAKVVQEALDEGDEVEDNFDEEEVERIQDELIPKALRFNSPGRKANLSIFVEGKRKRKSPARFVQK